MRLMQRCAPEPDTLLAKQEGRIREAISTWPLAPRSGSLSGYPEIYDRELAHAEGIRSQEDLVHRAAERRPTPGSRAWRVYHRSGDIFRISRLPFCSRCCRCAWCGGGPDAALIDFSWWRRLFGPGGVATAQQTV
jgi:hypothetical protein